MLRAMRQSDHRQRRLHVLLPVRLGKVREQQWQLHVPFRREHGHQIVKLENETDVARAPRGEGAVGQLINSFSGDDHRAFGRPVKAADQIQQGGLARTRRTHQREEFTGGDLQMQVRQHVNILRTAVEDFSHILNAHQRAIV